MISIAADFSNIILLQSFAKRIQCAHNIMVTCSVFSTSCSAANQSGMQAPSQNRHPTPIHNINFNCIQSETSSLVD